LKVKTGRFCHSVFDVFNRPTCHDTMIRVTGISGILLVRRY